MKTTTLILATITIAAALATHVQAQFAFVTNADNTITITGYAGSGEDVTMPSTINGLPVTGIGEWAFYATSVTNVMIPDSIINIADGAFFDCISLSKVTLGDNVLSVGDWAFAFCSSLMSACFRGNAPDLGGTNVFYGCMATNYYLAGGTNWGSTFGGLPAVLWDPAVPYNYGTNNGTITILGYYGSGGSVAIPSTINFLPVTTIAASAFYGRPSLKSVTIPYGVTNIGSSAFASCIYLTNVTIPEGITTITLRTFQGCSSLAGVVIPNSVTSIGDIAFYACSGLTSMTIPNGVTSIGGQAFYECSGLTNVTMGNSVTDIVGYAFAGCSGLTSIMLPHSVTSIGIFAFSGCTNLTGMTIPNGVGFISGTFSGCSGLTNVTMGNSVTNIGARTFGGCSRLTSIILPDSVTIIAPWAFIGCTSLTSVTIPSSVTIIGDNAFQGCTDLTSVYCKGNAPPLGGPNVFAGDNATVYYLPGTTGWTNWVSPPPAVLWNPQPQTPAVQANQIGFNITGATNIPIVVEASANLANASWTALQTCTLTNGSIYFSDPQWTNYPARLYRIRSP